MVSPRLVQIAVIGAPHGVRGEARVKTFTQDPLSLEAYGPLTVGEGPATLKVASLRVLKDDMVVARFEGVSTREAVQALTGKTLSVAREKLPATDDEDDFYHADLIGLRAERADGTLVGEVTAVPNYGADDLIEIRLAGERRTALLPFTKAVVPVVDVAGGRVVVEPPEGALEAAKPADDGKDG
ncbi:ribosome maturation factor RimM [Chenggangzhangella methanolivorans]|uniref:Ribosome maturation factor RimM n=1 Tax=Chenggangzhangella methanolivorans TaxID=1437009 RepID=A0A9E6RCN2_9HYPH|nr:ribosome maturation factor RimM [Chenggangzhangella methanolivorans]QZN98326.1 ribosome maturation factor RimM [Chenggangzhangella methanolivorans]